MDAAFLPESFKKRMQEILGESYDNFLASYQEEKICGLRVNTNKISLQEFEKNFPFPIEKIPWVKNGYYFQSNSEVAKHPYHFAGAFYIQEPTAMLPATFLDVQPGERVLDLCAAPGGKSTQLGIDLKGQGILVANDISYTRAKILSKNIRRFGIANAYVTAADPNKLKNHFFSFFDKILIDAPCSGEGMIRKDAKAAAKIAKYSAEKCCCLQQDILSAAYEMLAPEGTLVYSTCTFNTEENEKMIRWFLKTKPEMFLDKIEHENKLSAGIKIGPDFDAEKVLRAWPHLVKGEGHFVAKMRKKGKLAAEKEVKITDELSFAEKEVIKIFLRDNFQQIEISNMKKIEDAIYAFTMKNENLAGISVLNSGCKLGSIKHGKFVPAHSLALIMQEKNLRFKINFSSATPEIYKYLRGETLANIAVDEKGWYVVCVDQLPIGWAKYDGQFLKNCYPKGWRLI